MKFIGVLSGTSLDAVDAAICEFGPNNRIQLIACHALDIPKPFRERCLAIMQDGHCALDELGMLDVTAAELFAQAIETLLEKTQIPAQAITAIGSHGQTLWHNPTSKTPFTLQIGDPNILFERTQIPVVSDFRRRDMAAGGQGAPLAPALHAALFHSEEIDRFIINIGGISNLTYLPKDKSQPIIGFDTGPGNGLLDAWVTQNWQKTFDEDGIIAQSATPDLDFLTALLDDPYFQQAPPKSTGKEVFNLNWLENKRLNGFSHLNPETILATLVSLTTHTIYEEIQRLSTKPAEIYLCGGGALNLAILKSLSSLTPHPVLTTEALGVHPSWVEAILFAWLAKQTIQGQTGNIPSVTGAHHAVVLGGIYGFTVPIR